jgi:hypothetical protein
VLVARATEAREEPGTLRGNAHKLLALLRASGELPVARLADAFANARDLVGKLEQRGLVSVHKRERERDPFFAEPLERDVAPELTEAQARAADAIRAAIGAHETSGLPALRHHRLRQDGGVPLRDRGVPRGGPRRADDGAGDRAHAAARGPLPRALRRRRSRCCTARSRTATVTRCGASCGRAPCASR